MDVESVATIDSLEDSISGMESLTTGPSGPFSESWLRNVFSDNTKSAIEHCLRVLITVTNSIMSSADDLMELDRKHPNNHRIIDLRLRYASRIKHLMSMVDMMEEWYNR